MLFPYETIRPIQGNIIQDITHALNNKEHIIFHAPTGLGKSAAALAPAITYAKKNKCTVFFLTSRHTQHQIAIETLQTIKAKHNIELQVADIIGKKWMCLQPAVQELRSTEFAEFCRQTVAHGTCDFYTNTRSGFELKTEGKKAVEEAEKKICHAEELIHIGKNNSVCPYEITLELIKKADIIVGDYSYIFNTSISETLFKKTGKSLENTIVIVDEAHNLPKRVREAASSRLTSLMLKNAIKEAKKYNYKQAVEALVHIQNIFTEATATMQLYEQALVKKEVIIHQISEYKEYNQFIKDMDFIADAVRETQKKTAIGGVVAFLKAWKQQDIGFARILERTKTKDNHEIIALHYKCLDPSVVTKEIIKQTHTTILMSGTLTPTNMYRDILGFEKENTTEHIYQNPFPEKNRLALVVPKTTTKFTQRSEQQFNAIAQECAVISNAINGNTIVFFPSYAIRDHVQKYFVTACNKTTFLEIPGMSKEEKTDLLNRFKSYNNIGAVLLAAVSGSYGEGIDLPGDLLKCVIVVGLPLTSPDLETKQLIAYFDHKFQRGWDYGYVFPAFNKALQNAGRCIRTEKDRGVIIFLDERYIWPMYRRCFPEDWNIELSKDPEIDVKLFFGKS